MGHLDSWDAKITTFPGTYYLSAAVHGLIRVIVSGMSGDMTQCSSGFLRGVNLVMGWACMYVIHGIITCSQGTRGSGSSGGVLRTVLCGIFPLHAFFIFLYYTDTVSTLFVLSTWLALLKKKYILSGIFSACSILMRQTNAVWTVYLVGWELANMAMDKKRGETLTLGAFIRFLWADGVMHHVQTFWIHILSVVSFAWFVIHNGGIVLGDKEHHVPVTHWAQPLYFYTFLVLSTAPLWFPIHNQIPHRSTVLTVVGIMCLAFLAVRAGTLVHPFILADNRHYTFYLWRRILGATTYSRYCMVPLYALTTWLSIFSTRSRPAIQSFMLAACTAIVLIPAHLVEFRYFTIPWYLYMLDGHSVLYQTAGTVRIVCTIVGYLLINAITMYVFLNKSFTWPDGSIARFMW